MPFLMLILLTLLIYLYIRYLNNSKKGLILNNKFKRIDIFHTAVTDANVCLKVFITNQKLGLNNVKIFETNERSQDDQAIQALKILDPDLQNITKINEVVNYGYKLTIDKI